MTLASLAAPGIVALGRLVAGTDPLGPNDLDVEEIRDLACAATSPDRVCQPPPETEPPPPPEVPDAGGAGGLGALGQLLILLLVLALVAALVWIVWQMVSERSPREEDDEAEVDHDEELDDVRGPRLVDDERPPDRWRRAAADHRARGEHRDAIRCEYRALVGDLARAGYVDEIPGRTSGEEREQVASIAPAGSPIPDRFAEAADRFDVAWFDDAEVTALDDERFVAAASAVLDQVLGGSRR